MENYIDSLEEVLIDVLFDLDPKDIQKRTGLSLKRSNRAHEVYKEALNKYELKYGLSANCS